MKITKTISLIIIIMILVLLFSSCTKEVNYIDDVEDDAPIRIYLIEDEGLDRLMIDYIRAYNSMKPEGNRNIEITEFKLENIEEMYARILNEISAGKGPDIITINTKTNLYLDICKISKRNCFADMDIFIENSQDFDFNDYNKSVLDAGIIDDKRVFMPITYKVEYLIGAEECFKNNNIEIPDELTLDIYIDILKQYYQNECNKPAMSGRIDPIYMLSHFFEYGKPLEKSDELQRLFNLFKIENKRYITAKKNEFISEDEFLGNYEKLINSNNLFMKPKNIGYNQFIRLYENYNVIENKFQSKIVVFNQPTHKTSPTKSYIENGIALAININSKHKNEVFDFVQYMLSKQVQSARYKMTDLPVNNDSYEEEINNFVDNKVAGYDQYISHFVNNQSYVPEKMKNDFIEYIESAETCEYIGNIKFVYHNIMNESIEDYYNDRLTFDEMIDEINNKLSIYYSE